MKFFTLCIAFFFCVLPFSGTAQFVHTAHRTADSLYRSGNHAAAIDYYATAQRAYKEQGAWRRFTECSIEAGVNYSALSKFKEADTQIKAVWEILEGRPVEDTLLLLKLYKMESSVGINLGQIDRVEIIARDGLAYSLRMADPDYSMVGNFYNNLGVVHGIRRQPALAQEYFQKALTAFERTKLVDIDEHLRIRINLAFAYAATSDYQKAEEYMLDAERLADRHQVRTTRAVAIYTGLGQIYGLLEDWQKAAFYQRKALALGKERIGMYHPNIVITLQNMGIAYRNLGDMPAAEQYLREGLAMADSILKGPHRYRVSLLNILAGALAGQSKKEEAVRTWQKAISEAKKEEDQRNLPDVYFDFGEFHKENGDTATAVLYLQNAIALCDKIGSDDPSSRTKYYLHLGEILFNTAQPAEALSLMQMALKHQMLDPLQIDAAGNTSPDNMALSTEAIRVLAGKAKTLCQMSRESDLTILRNALATCELGLAIVDRFRGHFQQRQDATGKWAKYYQELCQSGIWSAAQLFAKTGEDRYLRIAYDLADRNRSVDLADNLQDSEALSYAGVSATQIAQAQALARQITYYERQLLQTDRSDQRKRLHHEEVLFNSKREYKALLQRIEEQYPRYAELKSRPIDDIAAAVQKTLDPDALLIEYAHAPQDNLLHIFTIERDRGLSLYSVPLTPDYADKIDRFKNILSSVFLPQADKRQAFIGLSHELYQQYIQPIASRAVGKKKLIIIGDLSTYYMPFEVLLASPEPRAYSDLDYLVRRFAITYHYSGHLYARSAGGPPALTAPNLLVFAPVFDKNDNPDAANGGGNVSTAVGSVQYPPLPFSETEARSIAALFHSASTVLLRHEANESNLKTALQRPYQVVHLSSHSFTNLEQPKMSGLACAPSPASRLREEDGLLYVGELYNLRVMADLVVLSSSESGVGALNATEGMLGLNRAFTYAGAQNVIYALWKIRDQSSSELMIQFYREMLAGAPYAAALQKAKLSMLGNPATASPGIWSAFLLIGR